MSASQLAETQREFFSALLMPLRGQSRKSTDLPANEEPHDPAFLATAERLIGSSPTLWPAECLELYHRQYWFRILDSLEEDFPGLIHLIGKETFWEIAEAYLLKYPSRSFTLRHLGQRLPDFIREHITDPILRKRAVAVAEIESALMDVFEAPDAIPISPERIAGGSHFTLNPAVILLAQQANASDWLHDSDQAWSTESTETFHCAIWRTPNHGIRHAAITATAFRMLAYLRGKSMSLNDWLAASGADILDPSTLTIWFSEWRDRSWFVAHSTECQH